jgi:hypothetical protein
VLWPPCTVMNDLSASLALSQFINVIEPLDSATLNAGSIDLEAHAFQMAPSQTEFRKPLNDQVLC